MSDDKRLGADPLGWIGKTASMTEDTAATPEAAAAMAAPGASDLVYERIIFPGTRPESEDEMGKSGKLKLEQDMEAAAAVAHLEDFVESMKSGHISAESGEESLSIPVAGTVTFEMKLSRKKDRAKCSFELEWSIDPETEQVVKISGKEC